MDLNYMFLRQQVETSMAECAPSETVRKVHDALARQYELEIEGLTGRRKFFQARAQAMTASVLPSLSASS